MVYCSYKEDGMSLKQWYKRRADRDSGAEDLAPPREQVCYTAAAPRHPVPLAVTPPPPRKFTASD